MILSSLFLNFVPEIPWGKFVSTLYRMKGAFLTLPLTQSWRSMFLPFVPFSYTKNREAMVVTLIIRCEHLVRLLSCDPCPPAGTLDYPCILRLVVCHCHDPSQPLCGPCQSLATMQRKLASPCFMHIWDVDIRTKCFPFRSIGCTSFSKFQHGTDRKEKWNFWKPVPRSSSSQKNDRAWQHCAGREWIRNIHKKSKHQKKW